MPYIHLRTTAPATDAAQETLTAKLTDIVATDFKKDAGWVMVSLSFDKHIHFQGSAEQACYVRVELLGEPATADTLQATKDICQAIQDALGIPKDRIYITYFATDNWGWNDTNF